jgi:hypothetical protein
MLTFAEKPKGTHQASSAKPIKASRSLFRQSDKVRSILQLQRTVANQGTVVLPQLTAQNIDEISASHTPTKFSSDFGHIPVNSSTGNSIQAKLKINAPEDRYEQEADRIADEVLQKKIPEQTDGKAGIQAKISHQATGGASEVSKEIESHLSQKKGSGRPICDSLRAAVEPHLQFDVSNIRIHTDNEAARMSSELNAKAFTYGNDIYFGNSQYQPQSTQGLHLIAHEMTHVVQQSQVPSNNSVQRVLSLEARDIMKDTIIDEMQTAHTDFDVGAVQAERDITAAARANAETAKVIFGIGMALIVPGFGGAIGRVGATFGVSVAENTANVIGGAIGEAAKSAGNSAIDQQFSSNPRRFFSAITSGFEAAQRSKKTWLRSNVNDTSALPDHVLQDLKQYWIQLASNNESADWATWFREQWDRFQAQVEAIGPQGTGMVPYGPTPLSNDNIPARIRLENGGTRLALVNKTRVDFTSTWEWIWGESDIRTRYRFLTWIDDDLATVATGRVSSVPTLTESQLAGIPD